MAIELDGLLRLDTCYGADGLLNDVHDGDGLVK